MKPFLMLIVAWTSAAIAQGQDLSRPLPSVIHSALPATPAPTMVTQSTNYNGGCIIPLSTSSCQAPQGLCPASASGCWATRGTACERLRNWLTFRVCEPNHAALVPFPYHAPLRAYFPVTPAAIGANGPRDCNATRPRIWSWEPKSCGTTCNAPNTSCVTTRPAMQFAYAPPPSRACDLPCATVERKHFFRRMLSFFTPEGFGFHRCGTARSPMACQNHSMCTIGGTCAAPSGYNYHYAGNQAPAMMYPGVPAVPVSATRPFTNP